MYQLWTLFWRISVEDLSIVFGGIGATHADLMEAIQSFVCVLASTAEDWHQLYMYKRGNQLG